MYIHVHVLYIVMYNVMYMYMYTCTRDVECVMYMYIVLHLVFCNCCKFYCMSAYCYMYTCIHVYSAVYSMCTHESVDVFIDKRFFIRQTRSYVEQTLSFRIQ